MLERKTDSNPRPPAWKASALSTELFPPFPPEKSLFSAAPQHKVNFLHSACTKIPQTCESLGCIELQKRAFAQFAQDFRNLTSVLTPHRALQGPRVLLWARMDSNHRSVDAADLQSAPFGHSGTRPYFHTFLSLLSDSNQRPRDYKSRALPAELKRQNCCFRRPK